MASPSPIEQFIARYRREFDFYDQAARLAAQKIDGAIQAAGIRAIVTSRAKHPARLDVKVRQRNTKTPYATVDDIYEDIVDLAGVRIALYFPADREEIGRLVSANFELLENPKEFPTSSNPSYKKRFSGYWATHYRLRLRESDLSDVQKRYGEARLELQVASLLMHAWSEVEHDLVYKPLEGKLSEEEYSILDELNGLIMAGEIALERLQKAIEVRVAEKDRWFATHYDLAAYLLDKAREILRSSPSETALGRIDLLYALVSRLELAAPDKISPFLKDLHGDTDRRPLSEQIIDAIIGADPKRYKVFSEIRKSAELEAPNKKATQNVAINTAIGAFLQSWIAFEKAVRTKARVKAQVPLMQVLHDATFSGDQSLRFEWERIRGIRNELVHGLGEPDVETLGSAAARLGKITSLIRKKTFKL